MFGMKKITLLIAILTITIQGAFAWDWPSARNYNGSTPEQPSTIYLGDQGTFGHDSWSNLNSRWPKWRVVIHSGADIHNGTYGSWSSYSNVQHKQGSSPRFTTTGTWYWGMQVEYTDAGGTTAWYCRNNSNWHSMYGTPTSDLTITVSALSDPTSQSATASSNTQINLSWEKWNSKNVMVVRRLTSASASNAPTQGTAYSVGNTLGTGTVVYNGAGISFNDTGLTPGTGYTYMLYSENYSYYSTGSTATATTTAVSAASDYFRSKATGNWNTASSWESSTNGSSNWITATLVPGSSATAITILDGHNITLDANVSVSGLTINTGGTFTASDAIARTLTIDNSTAGTNSTLTNNGTWANGSGASTVVFTGNPSSGNAVHAISGTIVFQNLTVNKTGGSSNVGASFGANSSLTGTLEIGAGGYISTIPPEGFYGTGSILKFNQGAPAIYDVNPGDKTWSASVIPNNITVSSGKVRVNENRDATGDLIISSGATLELSAAKHLSVNTALTNNGSLILKSAENIGTATIITTGTVGGSGTTTVEQFISSAAKGSTGRNWYISSPLSAATSSTITTATGNDLVYYDGTTPWANAEATMAVMKGYIAVSPDGNKTIQFTGGSLNTGNQSVINLPAGFNLVGNPYASYVDFTNATKTNVANSIWYRSKSTEVYKFHTYNVTGGTGVNDGTTIIPPMQSFWIKTTSATNTFGFTNTLRLYQAQTDATKRLKAPASSSQKLLRLEVANGEDKDETVVYFNDGALNTFDDYDSQKMFNETAGAPELYTFSDNKNLVINGFNSIQLDTEIPVGFRTGNTDANVNFKLKASQLQNFGTETELVLIDRNGSTTETVLNEGSEYSFNSTAVNTTNRFSLVFRAKGSTTGGCCYSTFENKIRIQKNESNQIVVNCDSEVLKNATIAVYNAAGQKLMQQSVQSSTTILSTAFKSGVYLVKLQSEGKIYNVKVAI